MSWPNIQILCWFDWFKYFFDEYVGLGFEMNLIFEYKKGQPSNLTLRTTTDVLFTTSYKILQLTFKNFENVYTYLLTSINEDIVFFGRTH